MVANAVHLLSALVVLVALYNVIIMVQQYIFISNDGYG